MSVSFAVKDVFAVLEQGQIDVQTVAWMIAVDFWQERRVQTVYRCHGLDHAAERDEVVGSGHSGIIREINFVLTRTGLVVRGLRTQVHFLQRQTNLTADVFALVQRRDVHVRGVVVRSFGRQAFFVLLEQIELAFRADFDGITELFHVRLRLTQHLAGVALKRRAVRILDVAEKAHNAPL